MAELKQMAEATKLRTFLRIVLFFPTKCAYLAQ
jgi:hypothetical protein